MDRINAWTIRDIPPQKGRLAVVTGSTQGIGYQMALALAGAGAEVIVCARTVQKGESAVKQILKMHPASELRYELLDLARLASVHAFAQRLLAQHRPLDLLVTNAAIMTPPKRQVTEDGFEAQFQVNYLGHFALTALLLPLLRKARSPRVTQTGSVANRDGKINFNDLQSARQYKPMVAYSQSKLANLLFTLELQRRSDAHGWGLMSNSGHPGISSTDLTTNSRDGFSAMLFRVLIPLMAQSPSAGALPPLYAATSPDAEPMGYYGPKNMMEMRGPVSRARVVPLAKDEQIARRLWEVSEELSKVSFPAD
jgi:NAD(P)-dependent dehydrogenase (short-subunit alcohol dehydrogenase family)